MNCEEIVKKLKAQSNAKNLAGMKRFGISSKNTLGVSMPALRIMAKEIGKDHKLALELWQTEIHEARILAGLIDLPELVTKKQMDIWANGFDSWDVCDQVCMNLFFNHSLAFKKCAMWPVNKSEFVRRAGFALMACVAVKNKRAEDIDLIKFFLLIKKYATDERNYVRKAVNWALRQIGKRNLALNKKAIACAQEIIKIDNKTARWIAADALRELQGEVVQKRVKNK